MLIILTLVWQKCSADALTWWTRAVHHMTYSGSRWVVDRAGLGRCMAEDSMMVVMNMYDNSGETITLHCDLREMLVRSGE